jgi:hypothetical protein
LRVRVEVGQGLWQTALLLPRHAAIVIGFGKLRIEPDRFVVVRDGAVEVAPVFMFNAAIQVDFRKLLAPELTRRNGTGACRDGSVAGLPGAAVQVVCGKPSWAPLREPARSAKETTGIVWSASASRVASAIDGRSRDSRLLFLLGADPASLVGGAARLVR